MTPLTADQLKELYGPPADTWPSQGLTAVAVGDRTEVYEGDVLIGWVEPKDYPHLKRSLPTYSVIIATLSDGSPWDIAFPGTFIPSHPARARRSEQQRWLPASHPDRQNGAMNA